LSSSLFAGAASNSNNRRCVSAHPRTESLLSDILLAGANGAISFVENRIVLDRNLPIIKLPPKEFWFIESYEILRGNNDK
jgi:hypothetical protein